MVLRSNGFGIVLGHVTSRGMKAHVVRSIDSCEFQGYMGSREELDCCLCLLAGLGWKVAARLA